jgi:hypothetical protein
MPTRITRGRINCNSLARDLHGWARIENLARIKFFAVADAENEHHEAVVLQRTDQTVISDAVFPEFAESALKSCPDFPGIVEPADALVEEFQNTPGHGLV